jgi:hypothetical protein
VPAKPRWLLDIPAIIENLERMEMPVVDRAMCERLFGLRRRRTIDLMGSFGGYQTGNAILIDRRALIDRLRNMAETPEVVIEQRRKERLSDHLSELHRFKRAAQVKIAVNPEVKDQRVAGLSPAIQLRGGQLTIAFADVHELLSKLYMLSQAAANDFDTFCTAIEGGNWPGPGVVQPQ